MFTWYAYTDNERKQVCLSPWSGDTLKARIASLWQVFLKGQHIFNMVICIPPWLVHLVLMIEKHVESMSYRNSPIWHDRKIWSRYGTFKRINAPQLHAGEGQMSTHSKSLTDIRYAICFWYHKPLVHYYTSCSHSPINISADFIHLPPFPPFVSTNTTPHLGQYFLNMHYLSHTLFFFSSYPYA